MFEPVSDADFAESEACRTEQYLQQLQAPRWYDRQRAAWSLRHSIADCRVQRFLIAHLLDDDSRVRREALRSLARASSLPNVRAAVQLRLSDPDSEVRLLARRMLDGTYDPI